MYRKTEVLAVHGANIMKKKEFTKKGKTIVFYQNDGDAKFRFKIKDEDDLTHWLLLNTKTHRYPLHKFLIPTHFRMPLFLIPIFGLKW